MGHAFILFLSILVFSREAFSASNDICDILKLPNCQGVTKQLRRSSASSLPSSSLASSLNPANVSFDRGVGLDILAEHNNPVHFGLLAGTGKMGGALINGSVDNGFFGNRVPELDGDRLERELGKVQYRNKKLTVAIGGKLTSSRNYGIDAGLILKRHPEIKDVNPGIGFSARVWKINFGASYFKDDSYTDLSSLPGVTPPFVEDDFYVTTYTAGTRIGNFSFDYGVIKSDIESFGGPTVISIFSSAYQYENFLFNLAVRNERSKAPEFVDGMLVQNEEKGSIFAAIQYSVNQHIIFGVNYNHFLLRDLGLSLTLFL